MNKISSLLLSTASVLTLAVSTQANPSAAAVHHPVKAAIVTHAAARAGHGHGGKSNSAQLSTSVVRAGTATLNLAQDPTFIALGKEVGGKAAQSHIVRFNHKLQDSLTFANTLPAEEQQTYNAAFLGLLDQNTAVLTKMNTAVKKGASEEQLLALAKTIPVKLPKAQAKGLSKEAVRKLDQAQASLSDTMLEPHPPFVLLVPIALACIVDVAAHAKFQEIKIQQLKDNI